MFQNMLERRIHWKTLSVMLLTNEYMAASGKRYSVMLHSNTEYMYIIRIPNSGVEYMVRIDTAFSEAPEDVQWAARNLLRSKIAMILSSHMDSSKQSLALRGIGTHSEVKKSFDIFVEILLANGVDPKTWRGELVVL